MTICVSGGWGKVGGVIQADLDNIFPSNGKQIVGLLVAIMPATKSPVSKCDRFFVCFFFSLSLCVCVCAVSYTHLTLPTRRTV